MGEGIGPSTAPYNKWDVVHSQTSAGVDWEIDNNGTWEDAWQFDPDGQYWDLLGVSIEMDVQRNAYDETPLLSMSTSNGRIKILDALQRIGQFNVPAADIQANLKPGIYVYDLVMIYDPPTNIRVLLMHGTVTVMQGVTYPPAP